MSSVTEAPAFSPYRDLRTRAEEIVDEIVKQQVLSGIELLERQYGPDWVLHVDPSQLSMQSADRCVVGQLYGGYCEGMSRLGLLSGKGRNGGGAYGFYVHTSRLVPHPNAPGHHRMDGPEWDDLNDAWKLVIAP